MQIPSIGVIGGMGPRATVEFERKLVNRFTGEDQSIPAIVSLNRGLVPDRTKYLLGGGENPAPHIQDSIDMLDSIGADVFVMPCNTAHAPKILSQLDFKGKDFLNMPDLVACVVAEQNLANVAAFTTEGTAASGFYQDILATRGKKLDSIPNAVQDALTQVIYAKKRDTKVPKASLNTINKHLRSSQYEAVILGCTELSLAEPLFAKETQFLDSLDVLADATKEYARSMTEVKNEARQLYA